MAAITKRKKAGKVSDVDMTDPNHDPICTDNYFWDLMLYLVWKNT